MYANWFRICAHTVCLEQWLTGNSHRCKWTNGYRYYLGLLIIFRTLRSELLKSHQSSQKLNISLLHLYGYYLIYCLENLLFLSLTNLFSNMLIFYLVLNGFSNLNTSLNHEQVYHFQVDSLALNKNRYTDVYAGQWEGHRTHYRRITY